ncbi:collagen alpha-1(VII) chain-like [Lytechinus variegatus]|uniref:collagen alpha-1(VII) chain-like n=1 Tax=Lytechinus variegatus TaxID=7654 RepID=UPI001BB1B28E|nr:collagen alpha-1(VII) chain-like [Lytechinus variegatus]
MTMLPNKLLPFVFVITALERTTCQIFSSQQEDEGSQFPRYPGDAGGTWYPRPGGPGAPGGGLPGPLPGGRGGGFPAGPVGPGSPGARGNYPGRPGAIGGRGMPPPAPGLHTGAVASGPVFPPIGSELGTSDGDPGPQPSFQEGEGWGALPSDFDPGLEMGDPDLAGSSHGVDPAIGPYSSSPLYDSGDGRGASINDGFHHDSTGDHIHSDDAAGTDDNGSNRGTNSGLKPGEQESVKSLGIRQNMTAPGTKDDDFNYVGMYITVAVFITFMVTLVAIALIRGPQGPFKTKRTEEEIARGLDGGRTAGNVIVLSDGVETRTDAQWEQQPLRAECNDAVADVRVNCEASEEVSEGSTAVAMADIADKEEGV